MDSPSDVMIVSAFGRGHWLAAELAGHGFSVVLIDVTECLGRWTPEDWEGPFGFFQPETLTATQKARLLEEEVCEEVESGFTVWPPEGPLEARGEMSPYWLSSDPALQAVQQHFESAEKARQGQKKADHRQALLNQGFDQTWLIHLIHQVASPAYASNAQGVRTGAPLPFFSRFFVRRVSRRGFEQSLRWCESQGVQVFRKATVRDLLIESRLVTGLEIKSEWSGALLGKQLIWGLTSEETEQLSERVAQLLYPDGKASPQWSWLRYRFQLKLGESTEALPIHCVLVRDKGLPWTHSNLLILQRTQRQGEVDVWLRIPSHHRFLRSYLEELRDEVLKSLEDRIPGSEPKLDQMPQDYFYEYSELGPSAFGVYDPKDLKSLRRLQLKNLFFDGPECWTSLEWSGRFAHQESLLEKVKAWREMELKQQEQSKGKDEESDRTLHTP